MAKTLVAWARAVKARREGKSRRAGKPDLPPLWLFTDPVRLPDARAAVSKLPAGLAGVVLRHDHDPARAELARDLARICRARRLGFAIAGDWRMAVALHAGLHVRNGRRPGACPRSLKVMTASAHGGADVVRARRAGAQVIFLSPVFATLSHKAAIPLGPLRWAAMGGRRGGVAALGGIDIHNVGRLPAACAGIGAIGALR